MVSICFLTSTILGVSSNIIIGELMQIIEYSDLGREMPVDSFRVSPKLGSLQGNLHFEDGFPVFLLKVGDFPVPCLSCWRIPWT